jgi:hypothetical protein
MPKYIFKKERDLDNRFDSSTVEFNVDTESLEELITEFTLFLKAVGFQFDGELQLVEEVKDGVSEE